MTDKEDNFNEFLKQKVEESHFEYNEAYWLKAEKLIESSQPKKKPFWLGFGLGVISISIIGCITAIIINGSSKETQALNQNSKVSGASLATSESNDENTTSPNDLIVHSAINNLNKQTESTVLLASNSSLKQGNSYRSIKKSSQQAPSENSISDNLQASSNSKEDKLNSYSGNFSMVKNLSTNKLPISKNEYAEDEEEETITIAPPIVIDARKTVNNIKDIDVNIATACENQHKHEWFFAVLSGVSDSRGFEGNTVSDSRIGFGYFGGCKLAYKLDKNWFLSAQPLLYSRGAVNTSIETEKTDYDFGANADEFIVKNKALLFGEMPVSIGYRVLRHQISFGAGFEYLVNVKSDVKEFGTSNYTPNQWGYTEGFNRLGAIALFNYSFNVYNEFWLTMMVQKGFTDLTKSDYFTTNSKDKNFNLRIGLQYQFNNQKKKGK